MIGLQLQLRPPTYQGPPKHRWTERVLTDWWDTFAEVVPTEWLPVDAPKENRRKRRQLREYGCGSYGCVYPTSDPAVVFKLTTDRSEAAFVAAARSIADWPPGLVRYHGLFQLAGETHYRRPIYAIWRQAAQNVGELGYHRGHSEQYKRRFSPGSCRDFIEYLDAFQREASAIRRTVKNARPPARLLRRAQELKRWAWDRYRTTGEGRLKGAELVAYKRIACSSLANFMDGSECGHLVGDALDFYLERDLLLADLHLGNIGEAVPEDYTVWEVVITDPGHMVPLSEKWLEVKVPLLERD